MLELRAQRLCLIALSAENLRLMLDNPELLERNLGLLKGHAAVTGEVRDATQQMLDGVLRYPGHHLWYTNWMIVLKRPHRAVGGLCFKGPPNADGEVETGYGVDPEYQNRGLMTEALHVACGWALDQPGVKAVLAETDKSNLPSQRVLVKTSFVPFRETVTMRWWRLECKPQSGGVPSPSTGRG